MAYRPLVEKDRVKIVSKSHPAFGTFGTVTEINLWGDAKVEMGVGSCWFEQNDLMVASDTIYGMFQADRQYHTQSVIYKEIKVVDTTPECPYDGWDREDLIEKIKEMQGTIDFYEDASNQK